jgi:glutamate 5-kinase
VAQVLVTLGDTEERRRHLNARGTLETLLRFGVVPVINENDTVATEEIRFGDNDRLAARVAQMVSADTLVLLCDIDGLYTADPRRDPKAELVPEVREITPEVEAMAGAPGAAPGSGGMVPRTAHKRWIASTINPAGVITVDAGAEKALTESKSLLPAGVIAVEGDFERGDAVVVKNAEGREVARGLIAYSAPDARRILGHKSREIEGLLGYRGREEMIHRDDLVVS